MKPEFCVQEGRSAAEEGNRRLLLRRLSVFNTGFWRMMKYSTYLIFGAPGSGKGTQGKILGAIPRFFHFACGDVFRALDTRTPLGQAFLEYSSRGELVPDDLTVKLWQARIADMVRSHMFKPDIDSLVLDGIPRNAGQAKIMDSIIDVKKVFHLTCPDRPALIARLKKRALKENRFDDANEEVIRRRLITYDKESKPVLAHYGASMIEEIDATQPPVKVALDILKVVTQDL
jgi:adenylate kinase